MAHIDNLVDRIADPALRDQIAAEVGKLLERKDFGLVFQRHLPEDLEVPRVRARRGDVVRIRADESKQNHIVLSVRAGAASILAVDSAKRTVERDEPQQRSLDELVVVKDFDVPIYPGLEPLGEIRRGGPRRAHVVIEGENYYALETLLFTHERKIDAIYIDPPYNTGSNDWIYNDRFVASNDAYSHSKWLSFMERRLLHARRLLKDTGVIIVAIGDDEHHRLRMLLDQVFGDENFLANVTWQGSGKNDARYTAGGVDYMLIYARNESRLRELDVRWKAPKPGVEDALSAAATAWEAANHDSVEATRLYRQALRGMRSQLEPAVFRYDQIDDQGRAFQADNMTSPNFRANLVYEVLHPITDQPVPTPQNGWRYAQETMAALIADSRVLFGPDESTTPRMKRFLVEQAQRVPYPTFTQSRMPGSRRLEAILGDRRFPNPKDVDVVAQWIGAVTHSDAVILDFFAGSGTTAEAVMRLNAADGGTRQAILVTNNELSANTATTLHAQGHLPGDSEWEAEGVFHRVTRPRLETVTAGRRQDGTTYSDGLEENLAFFRLTYEDENLVALNRRFDAVAALLWLKAGGKGPVVRRDGTEPWSMPQDAKYGVLFDTSHARRFAQAVLERQAPVEHLYIVTDSESAFQAAVAYLPLEQRLETTRLYSDYLHSFEINGKN